MELASSKSSLISKQRKDEYNAMTAKAATNGKKTAFLCNTLIVMLLVILGLFVTLLVTTAATKKESFFLVTKNGQAKQIPALSAPIHTTPAVLKWASMAAVVVYTLEFARYQDQLNNAAVFFTPNGWNDYMEALTTAGTIKQIQKNRISVSAVVSGAPVVTAEGELNGLYAWRIKLPLIVSYQGASSVQQQTLLMDMLVRRMPTTDNPKGIGIEQINVQSLGNVT